MKLLCENMLVPSESNWLDLLRAAQLLNSLRLELQVMAFLKINFSVLQGLYENNNINNINNSTDATGTSEGEGGENAIQYSTISDFQAEFPGLLDDLLESRKILFPLPPSQLMIKQTTESHEATIAATAKSTPVFPMWALILAAVCLFVYQHISNIVSLGYFIPVFNVVFAIGLVVYAFRLFAKGDK